jgi:putative ABC transport system permease protein
MRWAGVVRVRLRSLFLRKKVEQELEEELRYHLEREIDEGIAAGMMPDDAHYAALQSVKDIEQRKEECRDMRRLNTIANIGQDLRYAIRSVRKNPAFALVTVLTMALGIGADTAVFSVVNGVLLKPLAYRDPSRIVTLTSAWKGGAKVRHVSLPDFEDWRKQSTAFSAMAYYRSSDEPTTVGSSAEFVRVARVSPEFFQVLSVAPVLGRLLSAEETKSGDSGAALVSYSYWQSHFAGNGSTLGQSLRAGGVVLTIVGVLPPRFDFPDKSDVWRTSDTVDRTLPRTSLSFLAIGRLQANVSLEQAQAQLNAIASRLELQYPDTNKTRGVTLTGMQGDMVGDVRWTLYLLLGAVSLVLLIACANVATLLLTRATARTREIAIRAAVGAGRGRIIRQLITESLLLALVAGALGLIVAEVASKALIALAPTDVPRLNDAHIDGPVLAFTFGVSVLCCLLFGLIPALYGSRVDLNDALKQGGARGVVSGGASRLRGAFVIAEIAVSVILVAGAGLVIKSFVALNNVALGFRTERVLMMKTSFPVSGPDADQRGLRFFQQLLSEISALPGVSAAGATMGPPGSVESAGSYWIDPVSSQLSSGTLRGKFDAVFSVVTPGTFSTLEIPLRRGRDFQDSDSATAPYTAIINETLARRAFPGQDPLGRTIFAGFDSFKPMKIVGIVGDVRQWGPARQPDAEIYMPYDQHISGAGTNLTVLVRTDTMPEALVNTLRRTVHKLSSDVPLKFTTMEKSLYEEVAAPRFRSLLLGLFAALSMCLAITGIYGVTAYVVGQRSNEIALRMAIGATSGQMLRLILRHGLTLAAVGMALGFVGSFAGARLLTSMLFEVKPTDPMIYAAVALLLGAVVLIASYLPARRAAKLDVLLALRQE